MSRRIGIYPLAQVAKLSVRLRLGLCVVVGAVAAMTLSRLATAQPRWKEVLKYDASNGAIATVFIDTGSVSRTGKLIRVWAGTDYSEFQEGNWYSPTGVSRAYMSERRLYVFDCQTRDIGYGSWAALDGRRMTGQMVQSENFPTPSIAAFPTAPGTVGAALAVEACRLTK